MKLHNLRKAKAESYTTFGCLWEKGECQPGGDFLCKDKEGNTVPLQTRVSAYWPDGSYKWTAHTADSALLTEEAEVLPIPQAVGTLPRHIEIVKEADAYFIHAGAMDVRIPFDGKYLFTQITHSARTVNAANTSNIAQDSTAANISNIAQDSTASNTSNIMQNSTSANAPHHILNQAWAVLLLEKPFSSSEGTGVLRTEYLGQIRQVELEEIGDLQVTVKYQGVHVSPLGEEKFPFCIRMHIGYGKTEISFDHTFFYDGDPEQDFLKGIGIRFTAPLEGELYQRHIKCMVDHGTFHESMVNLLSWHPSIPKEYYQAQMEGRELPTGEEGMEAVRTALKDMPVWSEYDFYQDSVGHFAIKKKQQPENCSYLRCLEGYRSEGGTAVSSKNGSILLSIRNFWEKYPSGYTFQNMDDDELTATIWFYSPASAAYDFRHYANRGYNQVCYEGYDYKGAEPWGIACTNQCSLLFREELLCTDQELAAFAARVKHPPLYLGTPEFYHDRHAFGYWSLPDTSTPIKEQLERQLDLAADFYLKEQEQRGWYGIFDYGDFMHTYDSVRHCWRYDMGGYAWDNTELVPTLWLWQAFLRSGREDLYNLAEALSRHTSEVDVYHMGKYKGLGSRHNVSHWGCPCKEARIAMAAHHRVFYYLTGDLRMGDIFDELKENEQTFYDRDPLGDFYDKSAMTYPSHARSGPDWSSLCANWMTQWERRQDEAAKEKILTGIHDLEKAPLGLISGSDFEFDPATCHLGYIGEHATGGRHLQICMGAPQIWMEMADLLEMESWNHMLAEHGRIYFLPITEQTKLFKNLDNQPEFSFPYMAAVMGAYAASYYHDKALAATVWKELLRVLPHKGDTQGFETSWCKDTSNQSRLTEIPNISTNFAAQWCLNVIGALEFISDSIPEDSYVASQTSSV